MLAMDIMDFMVLMDVMDIMVLMDVMVSIGLGHYLMSHTWFVIVVTVTC